MRKILLHLLLVLAGGLSAGAQNSYNILSLFPHNDKWKNYVMDVERGDISPGGRVIVWESNGGRNQLFTYDRATKTIRTGVNNNLVLDVAGNANPQRGYSAGDVILWNYNGGNNQQWDIEAVPGESSFYLRNVRTGAYLVHQTQAAPGQPWKLLMGNKGGKNSKWRLPDALATTGGGSTASGNFKKLKEVLPNPGSVGVYIISKSWYNNQMHTLDVENGNMRPGGRLIVWQLNTARPQNQMFVMEGSLLRVLNTSYYLSINANNEVVLSERSGAATWTVEQNKTKGSFRLRESRGRGYLGHQTQSSWGQPWKCIVGNGTANTHFDWTEGMPVSNAQVSEMRANGLAPAQNSSPQSALTGNPPAGAVAAGGANAVAAGGANVVAAGGANVIAAGGGNVIAAGGGNVIAAGGGNVVAAGGGN
ncbi:RICIN domain-containing protein [Flaviaesturariibacter aridisoli]|uniref:Ricin B lectin domain-containing protein n=1 Tax=Flaviaesturariibacter aridisoli TaxID=2545761 RepID=A0A4R4DWH5_9BACT|nr:RICIN domain-containing protein [Flaviaesturariibacter aridisoli]TCZ66945.1 hypothetical protein E0486_16490 [Flaviaesturariibacter aridisoli]